LAACAIGSWQKSQRRLEGTGEGFSPWGGIAVGGIAG
jgi:hypothetical protein